MTECVVIQIEMVATDCGVQCSDSDAESLDTCCVCLDEIRNVSLVEEQYSVLPCCKSKFHNKCLFELLLSKRDILSDLNGCCPLCRSDFDFIHYFNIENIKMHFNRNAALQEKTTDTDKIIREKKVINFILKKYYHTDEKLGQDLLDIRTLRNSADVEDVRPSLSLSRRLADGVGVVGIATFLTICVIIAVCIYVI